jgi:hypothetical protein
LAFLYFIYPSNSEEFVSWHLISLGVSGMHLAFLYFIYPSISEEFVLWGLISLGVSGIRWAFFLFYLSFVQLKNCFRDVEFVVLNLFWHFWICWAFL